VLFLAASLAQYRRDFGDVEGTQILVLSGRNMTGSGREAMEKIARASWPWDRIEWIGDLVRRTDGGTWTMCGESLSSRLMAMGKPGQLWFCMPNNLEEECASRCFPNAELHLYEDGLGTYSERFTTSQLLRHPRRLLKWIFVSGLRRSSMLRRAWPNHSVVYPCRHLQRAYFLLVPELPVPVHLRHVSQSFVTREIFLQTIRAIEVSGNIGLRKEIDASDRMKLLLMGQNWSDGRPGGWEQEYRIYQSIALNCVGSGYEVWWKEHPKAVRLFGPILMKDIKDIRQFEDRGDYPIELLIGEGDFYGALSASSTSLLTLSKLYGVKPYTFAHHIPFRLTDTIATAHSMLVNVVPPVEKLWTQSRSPSVHCHGGEPLPSPGM
jgi:hypothetical protein